MTGSSAPRILLADDDPFITALYRDKLTREGCRVECAANGEAALQQLQSAPPDLLVLDLNMPRMKGTEVLRFVRERSAVKDLPVIVLSNACAPDFIAEVNRYRPTRFLIKFECNPKEVVREIRSVLEETARTGHAEPAPRPVEQMEPVVRAELPDLLERLEGVQTVPEQREALLQSYRHVQEYLRALKGSHPLALQTQFGRVVEQWFEELYAREELLPSATRRSLRQALPLAAACDPQTEPPSIVPLWLLIRSEDQALRAALFEWCNRPGFLPLVLAGEQAAEECLAENTFGQVLWHVRRASPARKAWKRLRALPGARKVPLLFLAPPDVADHLNEVWDDPHTAALPVPQNPAELLVRLYAWRLSREGVSVP